MAGQPRLPGVVCRQPLATHAITPCQGQGKCAYGATLTGCDRAVQHCVNSPAVRPLSLGRWSGRSVAPCASLWVSSPIGAPGNLRRGGAKRRKAPLKLRRAPPPIFYSGQVSSVGRFSLPFFPFFPPPGEGKSPELVWLGSRSTYAGGNREENNGRCIAL